MKKPRPVRRGLRSFGVQTRRASYSGSGSGSVFHSRRLRSEWHRAYIMTAHRTPTMTAGGIGIHAAITPQKTGAGSDQGPNDDNTTHASRGQGVGVSGSYQVRPASGRE